MVLAAAVCDVVFRVNAVAAALERDPAWVGRMCEKLAREQLWLAAPRAEEGSDAGELPYSLRHALFRGCSASSCFASAWSSRHAPACSRRTRARGSPDREAEPP